MVMLVPPLICNTGGIIGDTPEGTGEDRFSLSPFVSIGPEATGSDVVEFEAVGSDVIHFEAVGFDVVTSEAVSLLM